MQFIAEESEEYQETKINIALLETQINFVMIYNTLNLL